MELLPVIETTWNTWKRLYPNTEVIAGTTGWSRPYTEYPYGGYRTDDSDTFAELTRRCAPTPTPKPSTTAPKTRC